MGRRTGADRRRFTRVSQTIPVTCVPRVSDQAVEARALNFSAGGVLFVSPLPLESGVDVDVELGLDGPDGNLCFPGRIVRVRNMSDNAHEVAIEFAGGDAGDQRALLDYIERHAGTHLHDPTPPLTA